MFTGSNYQIWFAPMEGERFNYAMDIKNIAESYGAKAGGHVGGTTAARNAAVARARFGLTLADKIRFFFGMHYKPDGTSRPGLPRSTGLVRVPLRRNELSAFEPLVILKQC